MEAPGPGVSSALALERSSNISDIGYTLYFDLTQQDIRASEDITFDLAGKARVVLDFKVPEGSLLSISANGKELAAAVADEHIVIPQKAVQRGRNVVSINFLAGTQSLNRRDGFLYTLLVPDRARTLFPCFDQPDLKAAYRLSLKLPEGWTAVSNTAITGIEDGVVTFGETEPLSTYLFSFVAGRFDSETLERDGRSVTMYHRETDPVRLSQCDEVLSQVFTALEWMEDWTGIPYPFAKYDFVVIPDFQYGGMEHTGATLYNDRRIFLGERPTTDELLSRASLIAHETAHMWFGDFVTMRWFDDVWTKEVFANWFAQQMVRPLFPGINHSLSDLKTLNVPAYEEDRTLGSNAIQRPLANLQDAGLIYCNIIYDKAPVVMEKLHGLMGPEAFREGLQEYLKTFAYSNATWDDLIGILDAHTDADLSEWSRVWVKERGMPVYSAVVSDGRAILTQEDPFGAGNVWQQEVSSEVADGRFWVPNTDGSAYGAFLPDEGSIGFLMDNWDSYDETARLSLLMTLYENEVRGHIAAERFVEWVSAQLPSEPNPLILSSLLSYASSVLDDCPSGCTTFEQTLREMAEDTRIPHERRLLVLRQLYSCAVRAESRADLLEMWERQEPCKGLSLSESDWTSISYRLMLWYPDRASEIASVQRDRITNTDRKETFDYVCRAVAPNAEDRLAFFLSLMDSPQARRPESRVLTSLGLLCDPCRGDERLSYIEPTLEHLEEIQRSGDIFFPASWCKAVLGRQHSAEAYGIVDSWLAEHPAMNPLLVTKVRQAQGYRTLETKETQ